ncbi:hypothetical protein ACXR2U_15790 [Jatrophihabitans sp. YIM 134969]
MPHRPTARRAAATVAAVAAVAVPALGLTVFATPASATPSPSAVLANTFPVQCTANGASTITGKLTVSAAGPANAAVGDTVTVTDYEVSLAIDNLPMDPAPFKGATPSFAVDGTFTSHTVLSGAITLGPVASEGTVQRATVSPQGMATLAGAASKPLAFPASVAGPVTVTTASPFLVTLNWYVTKVTPASGQSLPSGIPAVDTSKPYGTSTVSCTGNPVIPWGTVQIVKTAAQAGTPGALASTGTATENMAVVAGWALVVGVTVTFFSRSRRTT